MTFVTKLPPEGLIKAILCTVGIFLRSRICLSVAELIQGQFSEAKDSLTSALQFLDTGNWIFSAPLVISYVAYFAVDQQLIR